jgi:hypothetical protein
MRLFGPKPPDFPPPLSFGEEEAPFVRAAYAAGGSILEYGSGGSTVLAASLGKPVVAVESDAGWTARLNTCLRELYPSAQAEVRHADIGRTGKWGRPVNDRMWPSFASYPLGVWSDLPFGAPDLVLVDGRFRLGCLCAVILKTERPVRVLFDDYRDRAEYHVIESLLPPTSRIGRMAEFRVDPGMAIPPAAWDWIIPAFSRTRPLHGRYSKGA